VKLTTRMRTGGLAAAALIAGATAILSTTGAQAVAAGNTSTPLIGTFKLTAGANAGSGVKGSYFRMIQPNGTIANGPFVANGNSKAKDKTYTLLAPGTDGGFTTGEYQPEPTPAFDSKGNSLAKLIIKPTAFFGVLFGADTASVDPQTGLAVPLPSITVDGAGNLSGNLSAWGASWNNQEFNQGSPKPDGTTPGLTAGPTGTYNATTKAYTLDWTSLIVGGPFNGFTGEWHLTGTFAPVAAPTVTKVSPASGTAAGGTTVTITGTNLAHAGSVQFGGTAAKIKSDSASSIKVTSPAGSGTVDVTATTAGGTSNADEFTYVAAAARRASATVAAAGSPLVGTFELTGGAEKAGVVTGSYFRMIEPGGKTSTGPFLPNVSSSAVTKTYTLLSPGTDGGLMTGSYQAEPTPAFDGLGNSLAAQIIKPTAFFGIKFSVDTAPIDPQTGTAVPAPSISVDSLGQLSGDLAAWGASWNRQEFNQGSPKPNGTKPGLTAGPTGSYNASTGAFTLSWTSQIVGGPFNSFTGEWHLAGTFVPAGSGGNTPSVTSVTPNSGPPSGGTPVVITGSNLGGATAVSFGATSAKITADSPTAIVVRSPKEAAGAVDVTVTTAGGTSPTVAADRYTYSKKAAL
jgi:hypothetical protein